MKYAVDKIENDLAILQNIEDKKIIEVKLSLLPLNVKETDILVYEDNTYKFDNKEKENRVNIILEKMNRLRQGDNDDI